MNAVNENNNNISGILCDAFSFLFSFFFRHAFPFRSLSLGEYAILVMNEGMRSRQCENQIYEQANYNNKEKTITSDPICGGRRKSAPFRAPFSDEKLSCRSRLRLIFVRSVRDGWWPRHHPLVHRKMRNSKSSDEILRIASTRLKWINFERSSDVGRSLHALRSSENETIRNRVSKEKCIETKKKWNEKNMNNLICIAEPHIERLLTGNRLSGIREMRILNERQKCDRCQSLSSGKQIY